MATSGTINLTGDMSGFKARITWSASQSESTNKSTVSYKVQFYKEGSLSFGYSYNGWVEFWDNGREKEIKTVTHNSKTVEIKANTWTTVFTGSFSVSHYSSGNAPSVGLDGQFYASNDAYWYISRGSKISLSAIARPATIASAQNFTDEENPTMTYNVPYKSGTTLLEACISFDGSNPDIPYRDIDKNATSYTFELTEEERNILRAGTLDGKTTRTVYFYVRSTVNGKTTTKKLGKTLTIVNANPELSAFIMDTNEKTVALTGDSLVHVIKGYSNIAYEMNGQGVKGATVTSYSATNGGTTLNASSGVFTGTNTNTFKLSATDNRGLTATKEFTLNLVEYFKPSCSQEAKIELSGETEASIAMDIWGEFFNSSFGAVNNEVDVQIRLKVGSAEFTDWVSYKTFIGNLITNGNEYSIKFTVSGLPYNEQIIVQSKAVDALAEATTAEYTLKLIPVFDWGAEDFNFNVPVTIQGAPLMDYVIEQGTEPMGTNGTWYWSKWKNGKAECYGIRNYGNMGVSTAWGELYVSPDFNQDLPTGLFAQAPEFISITPQSGGYGTWISKGYNDTPTESTTGTFCVVRAKSNTLSQVQLSFMVVGRWK